MNLRKPEKTMYVCREECHIKAKQIQDRPIKSILINDSVHKLIVDKRYELQKAGIRIGLSELTRKVIMTCADKYVDKLVKKEEGK